MPSLFMQLIHTPDLSGQEHARRSHLEAAVRRPWLTMRRLAPTPLLGCAAILVDFIGLENLFSVLILRELEMSQHQESFDKCFVKQYIPSYCN